MKIYATTKSIIIGIIIIVSYIFKILEVGNNEPSWLTPSTGG